MLHPLVALRLLAHRLTGLQRPLPVSECDLVASNGDFGLHHASLRAMLARCSAIYDWYFRVESRGIENVPMSGPVMLIANHSGVLPMDAAMLCFDVLRGLQLRRIPRPVVAAFVSHLPLIGPTLARLGAVDANRDNVRQLLARGELIALWPEGVSGTAKLFRDRYQLQHWRHGFAALAMEYRAAIVPVAIVGAEESWPLLGKIDAHWLGAPYIPIPAWPLPLPVRYHIEYGAPMYLEQLCTGDCARASKLVRVEVERLVKQVRQARRGLFS